MNEKIRELWRIILVLIIGFAPIVALMLFLSLSYAQPTRAETNWAAGDSRFEKITLTATGTDGAAAGAYTSTTRLQGYIKAIHIDYTSSITTTTDLTIATVSPAATILTLTDTYTDAWYYPSVQFTGNTGAAVSGAYQRFPVDDYLIINATQTTSGTVAVITVQYGQ